MRVLGFLVFTALTAIVILSLPSTATAGPAPGATPTRAVRSCNGWDGLACTTPGTHFRCYHVYPTEPGICVCSSGGTWTCG